MSLRKHLLILSFFTAFCHAQSPVLVGYWQNWNDSNAPYIPLDQIDSRYNVVCVSFAVPTSPSDMNMLFTPDGVSQATLISQIQALRNQGKKVVISIGGATTSISLNDVPSREAFVNSMTAILNTYHFDGIDIDIEHGDSILAAGTISSPTNSGAINLVYAITQIRSNYFNLFSTPMMLTFAPETAYVQGGMSAYGGIWGGYLPILDSLRDNIDLIHVQLYNSGSMYGIDTNIYDQGSADFVIAMTEALIQGFNTAGGLFDGFPANKVVVGLPACPNAAGGGFTAAAVVGSAMKYLMGTGPKPGNYTLAQTGGYPNLGGMMAWSVNWDKVTTCNAESYEYAENFEQIFYPPFAVQQFLGKGDRMKIIPNPAINEINVNYDGFYSIYNIQGQLVKEGQTARMPITITDLKSGFYFIKANESILKFVKQ